MDSRHAYWPALNRLLPTRWPSWLAAFILAGALLYFFWPGIRPGYTFLPVDLANNMLPWRTGDPIFLQNWLVSDPLYQFYPFLKEKIRSVQQGEWLLWTPDIYLGHPAVADPLFQTFYPVLLLFGLGWGAERGFALALFFHALLAAFFTYRLLRSLHSSRPAALIAAFTYTLSGHFLTWFEYAFWTCTLAWLPGILWLFRLGLLRRRLVYSGVAGVMFGLALLGGQFQFALIFLIALAFYTLGFMIRIARLQRRLSLEPALHLGLLCCTGVLIASPQLWTFTSLLESSTRGLDQGLLDVLPPRQLITLVMPDFFGNPTTGNYWGWGNYNGGTIYSGIVALYLAGVTLCGRPRYWPLYGVLLVIILVYWSSGGPGIAWFRTLPVLKHVSLHRAVFILPLGAGLLAALALQTTRLSWTAILAPGLLLSTLVWLPDALRWNEVVEHRVAVRDEQFRALTFIISTLLLLAFTRWAPASIHHFHWAIAGLVFVDLVLFGRHYNPTGPVEGLARSTPSIELLQAQHGVDRVIALQRRSDLLLTPSTFMVFDLMEPGGYSSLVNRRLHHLVRTADPEVEWWWFQRGHDMLPFSYPGSRFLDLMNVRYIIVAEALFDPGPEAELVHNDCPRLTPELAAGQPLQGQFVVRMTAINRMDLPLHIQQPAPVVGGIQIRMWRGPADADLMLEQRFSLQELATMPGLTLYFTPEEDAPGRTYRWEITAMDAERTGVQLCADIEGAPAVSVYGVERVERYNQNGIYIYERLAPLPRAYVVYGAVHIPDENVAVAQLLDDSFDLRNLAISPAPLELPATSVLPATRADLLEYKNASLKIAALARAPGLLIVSDAYHADWEVNVDGRPATLLRVNHVMRGVALSPGEHVVEMKFKPDGLGASLIAAGFGFIIPVLLLYFERHYRKTTDNTTRPRRLP
jgi:hypothetical protein